MTEFEIIKQALKETDQGTFQNLCDEFLSRKGYTNKMSLGSKEGTRKTTKGTPDTYFYRNGKYILVEYTTQKKNIVNKIKTDISKCLNVADIGIEHQEIEEIIYFHISSNISLKADKEFRRICKKAGVKLSLIGIDQLTSELSCGYEDLIYKFLEVPIGTRQIQTIQAFVSEYDSNIIAVPLDTEFIPREIVDEVVESVRDEDVVILKGQAGVGKTRLALYVAQNYFSEGRKCYCVRSKNLELFEDMKKYFSEKGKYTVIIDDANQLSALQYFVQELNQREAGYDVKIIITVRDYAVGTVINTIGSIVAYKVVKVVKFNDDEIKMLVEKTHGITNPDYLERIIDVSEGNARIAVIAGRVACKSGGFCEIRDASQLYERYYGTYLQEHGIWEDKVLCTTIAIISFLNSINLENLDSIKDYLVENRVTEAEFCNKIKILHEMEYLDICNDKAVRISDQCLSNYLLKHMLIDKKIITLSSIVLTFFSIRKARCIESINMLITIFQNEANHMYIKSEIKKVWKNYYEKDAIEFNGFLRTFYRIDPTEALYLLRKRIELEAIIKTEVDLTDISNIKKNNRVDNDIIEILSGFGEMEELPIALDLFFLYFEKRPDLYKEFYLASIEKLGVQEGAINQRFSTQIEYLMKIKTYADSWKNERLTTLFIDVAKEYLKVFFTPAKSGRSNSIKIYSISLTLTKEVEKYRGLIWEFLIELCERKFNDDKIREALAEHIKTVRKCSIPVIEYDKKYIEKVVRYFDETNLKDCICVERIADTYDRLNVAYGRNFNKFLCASLYKEYQLLSGKKYRKHNFEERILRQKEEIKKFILDNEVENIKRLIDIAKGIENANIHEKYKVKVGIDQVLQLVVLLNKFYKEIIGYYLESQTPLRINPEIHVVNLSKVMGDESVYEFLNKYEYNEKNVWLYTYFKSIDCKIISAKHVKLLYEFLNDESDKLLKVSTSRTIDFLDKYQHIEPDMLEIGCELILKKQKYSPFIVGRYFSLMFNEAYNSPAELVKKFQGKTELLERIYIFMLENELHNDFGGKFLIMIFRHQKSILDKYIEYLRNKSVGSGYDEEEIVNCFFELDEFLFVYDTIFEKLIDQINYSSVGISYFLESILQKKETQELMDKQEVWIKHCIETSWDNRRKMTLLFDAIAEKGTMMMRKYVGYFVHVTDSYDAFRGIPLSACVYSRGGSGFISLYSNWIDYLKELLPLFNGINWLDHRKRVEIEIEKFKQFIKEEEIEEMLRW